LSKWSEKLRADRHERFDANAGSCADVITDNNVTAGASPKKQVTQNLPIHGLDVVELCGQSVVCC
jgi:hypothetical protein